jgi:hypothetical protein
LPSERNRLADLLPPGVLDRQKVFELRPESKHREKCRDCRAMSTCGFFRGFLEGRGDAYSGRWREGDSEMLRFCDNHAKRALRDVAAKIKPLKSRYIPQFPGKPSGWAD